MFLVADRINGRILKIVILSQDFVTLWAKSANIGIDAHLAAGHGSRSWPIVLGPQMAHMTTHVRYIITTVEL